MSEIPVPVSEGLLNRESSYIHSLHEAGFTMKEARRPGKRFNAIVYQQEGGEPNIEGEKNNLLMLYAVQGESGGTSHISASFLQELKPRVDTVIGFNSSLTKTSLEAATYDHDLEKQAYEMVELYEEEIPPDKRDQPLILVGHSMGGMSAPIVAKKLLEKGFNVSNVIMIAPPIGERSSRRMLGDFMKLGDKKHFYPDIPILYPSPMDIVAFTDRLRELSQKSYLNPEEKEEKAAYELAIRRQSEPDKLILSNMSQDKRNAVQKIDEEMTFLLGSLNARDQTKIAELQQKRRKILAKAAKKVLNGKINNEQTQHPATGRGLMRMVGHAVRSMREIKQSIADLGAETTVNEIQKLINYNADLNDMGRYYDTPTHALDITLIAGSTDPIPGDYEIGKYKETFGEESIQVGPHTTLSEINMPNFDHFTIGDDPVRVAQVVDRITRKSVDLVA